MKRNYFLFLILCLFSFLCTPAICIVDNSPESNNGVEYVGKILAEEYIEDEGSRFTVRVDEIIAGGNSKIKKGDIINFWSDADNFIFPYMDTDPLLYLTRSLKTKKKIQSKLYDDIIVQIYCSSALLKIYEGVDSSIRKIKSLFWTLNIGGPYAGYREEFRNSLEMAKRYDAIYGEQKAVDVKKDGSSLAGTELRILYHDDFDKDYKGPFSLWFWKGSLRNTRVEYLCKLRYVKLSRRGSFRWLFGVTVTRVLCDHNNFIKAGEELEFVYLWPRFYPALYLADDSISEDLPQRFKDEFRVAYLNPFKKSYRGFAVVMLWKEK